MLKKIISIKNVGRFRNSAMWRPDQWPPGGRRPSGVQEWRCQFGIGGHRLREHTLGKARSDLAPRMK